MIDIAGYIKLYRDLRNNEIWKKKPFSRGQAWVDILFSANHEDKKILFDGNLMEVKRGSFITSIRKLSEAWGWSRNKIVKFLNVCQLDEMLIKNSDEKKTLITVVNWDLYQVCEDNKKPQKSHRKDTERTLKDTNNNDKELIKNEEENKYKTALEIAIDDFQEFRKKIKAPMTDKAVKLLIDKLNKLAADDETKIAILNQSILRGWKGVFPLNNNSGTDKDWK